MTTPHPAESDTPSDPVDWDRVEEEVEAERPSGPHRRRWWVIGSIAVVVMSAMAVIWGLSATVGHVYWIYTGHQVVSEERVDVRLDLRRDPDRSVTCRIEAQNERHAVVGRTEVEFGPSPQSPSRHVGSVRTASPAVSGFVDECWYSDEPPTDAG